MFALIKKIKKQFVLNKKLKQFKNDLKKANLSQFF